ncbi:MAG: M48 family metalloprotease [Candidatus Hydrothermarchaeota archaeon]
MKNSIKISIQDERIKDLFIRTLNRIPRQSLKEIKELLKGIRIEEEENIKATGLTLYTYGAGIERSCEIIFYRGFLSRLSDKAVMGVIAHELAHVSFFYHHGDSLENAKMSDKEKEKMVNETARDFWGFIEEIDKMKEELHLIH